MEIAFRSLIVLFFIIFPGAVLRRFFYQGEFSKQYDSQSWYHSLFLSTILGVIVHYISSLAFYNTIYKFSKSDLVSVYNLYNTELINLEDLSKIGINEFKLGTLYFISVIGVAIGLGILGFWVVRLLNLDKRSLLKFNNHWHYYFTGEIIHTKHFEEIRRYGKITPLADVLVKINDSTTKLYSGKLAQHTIDAKTGKLENIYLTNVLRYRDSRDSQGNIQTSVVPGDVFIIPNESVININMHYIVRKKEKVDFSNILSVLLTIGYFIIWADLFNFFENYPIILKALVKFSLHGIWWVILSLIFMLIFRKRNEIPNKDFYAFLVFLSFFVITSLLTLYSYFPIIVENFAK